MSAASGNLAMASRSKRSQEMASTPRDSTHSRTAALRKRLTATTRGLCPAGAAGQDGQRRSHLAARAENQQGAADLADELRQRRAGAAEEVVKLRLVGYVLRQRDKERGGSGAFHSWQLRQVGGV